MPRFGVHRWLLPAVTALVLAGAGALAVAAVQRSNDRQARLYSEPDPVPESPTPRAAPDGPDRTALDTWQRYGGTSYEITETVTCRCPGSGQPVTLVVLDRKTALQPPGRPPLLSVDDLFSRLYSHKDARFTASYDAGLGYPARIEFDPRLDVTGDEVAYELTSYQPK